MKRTSIRNISFCLLLAMSLLSVSSLLSVLSEQSVAIELVEEDSETSTEEEVGSDDYDHQRAITALFGSLRAASVEVNKTKDYVLVSLVIHSPPPEVV